MTLERWNLVEIRSFCCSKLNFNVVPLCTHSQCNIVFLWHWYFDHFVLLQTQGMTPHPCQSIQTQGWPEIVLSIDEECHTERATTTHRKAQGLTWTRNHWSNLQHTKTMLCFNDHGGKRWEARKIADQTVVSCKALSYCLWIQYTLLSTAAFGGDKQQIANKKTFC